MNREKIEIKISGTGSFVPEKTLTNDELSTMIGTSDEWIYSRTGIKARRIADSKIATSDLAFYASKEALKAASLPPESIDAIIVATVTPDHVTPSTATILQHRLGCRKIMAFDFSAACAGFLYGLTIAESLIKTGQFQHVLLIGSEILSRITNFRDRQSCILFGDGAGAVVLSREEKVSSRVIFNKVTSDGRGFEHLHVFSGGSRLPINAENVNGDERYIKMNGRDVFRQATTTMFEDCLEALEQTGLSVNDIEFALIHQANKRIIEAVISRLELASEKVLYNIENLGNTSSASIPILLDQNVKNGKIQRGQKLLLSSFGAGFTSGTAILEY